MEAEHAKTAQTPAQLMAALQPWEQLDLTWQTKIARAIAPGFSVSALAAPQSIAELVELVTDTQAQRRQMLPCGAGSKLDWGGLVGTAGTAEGRGQRAEGRDAKRTLSMARDSRQETEREIQNSKFKIQNLDSSLLVVSTRHLNRLIEHAVGDLTVTVEAGMGFAELQAILAKAGQFLAIDPLHPEQATIGGIVATGDAGSLRQRYHSVRDMLLGISFVRADGQMAKAGGRVVKNVAGYDLMKLFTGSYGTLGILTQVTFRVYPLPAASETLVLLGSASAIAQAAQTLLSSALTPTHADLLSAALVENLNLGTGMGLAVRFQSIAPSVIEQRDRLIQVAQALGLKHAAYAGTEDADLWHRLPAQIAAASQDAAPDATIFCKIGIRPTEEIALLQLIDSLGIPADIQIKVQIHLASGLGRLTCDATILLAALLKIRSFCQSHSGFLSILSAPIATKQQIDVWGYSGNAIATMQAIKHQFDPHNLLSPGRFIGGI
jgi:glycolate oxidase FAD binding subunit